MDRSTYRTHAEIVSQFETQAQVDAEVRRILGSPLTESDLDAQERFKRAPFPIGATNHAHRYSRPCPHQNEPRGCYRVRCQLGRKCVEQSTPACSRCESGLSRCVTPDACERAEAEPKPSRAGDLVVVWALLLGAWAATAFVLLALGVRP